MRPKPIRKVAPPPPQQQQQPSQQQQKFVVEDVHDQYLVIAVFDYAAEDDGELSLSKHDIIEVCCCFRSNRRKFNFFRSNDTGAQEKFDIRLVARAQHDDRRGGLAAEFLRVGEGA